MHRLYPRDVGIAENGDPLRFEGDDLVHRAREGRLGLSGKPVAEIEVDLVESGRARVRERLFRSGDALVAAARLGGGWTLPFLASLAFGWLIPFALLLPRAGKRSEVNLLWVSGFVLVGQWLDLYLSITPAICRQHPGVGLSELGPLALVVAASGATAAYVLIRRQDVVPPAALAPRAR